MKTYRLIINCVPVESGLTIRQAIYLARVKYRAFTVEIDIE